MKNKTERFFPLCSDEDWVNFWLDELKKFTCPHVLEVLSYIILTCGLLGTIYWKWDSEKGLLGLLISTEGSYVWAFFYSCTMYILFFFATGYRRVRIRELMDQLWEFFSSDFKQCEDAFEKALNRHSNSKIRRVVCRALEKSIILRDYDRVGIAHSNLDSIADEKIRQIALKLHLLLEESEKQLADEKNNQSNYRLSIWLCAIFGLGFTALYFFPHIIRGSGPAWAPLWGSITFFGLVIKLRFSYRKQKRKRMREIITSLNLSLDQARIKNPEAFFSGLKALIVVSRLVFPLLLRALVISIPDAKK